MEIIQFGSYEQGNGIKLIEWLVLTKKNNKALILSQYALDCQPYITSTQNVKGETCTLRTWLNNDFYNAAFNSTEKGKIASTMLSNADNPNYGIDGGNFTTDKIFLLSIYDINSVTCGFDNSYDRYDYARRCQPTEYAKAQGCWVAQNYYCGNCLWWLRSPGYDSDFAAFVYSSGCVSYNGTGVNNDMAGVRPALGINLE